MAGWWAEIAQVVAPTTAALVITGGTPTVTVDENRLVVPSAAALTLTGGTPTVTATDNKIVTPTAASLSLTGGTPTVSVGVTVAPTAAALTVTGGTPTVLTPRLVTPTAASLTITGGTPSLGLTLRPTGASLAITGGIPTVTVAGPPEFDAANAGAISNGAASLSWTHTNVATADVFVSVVCRQNTSISAITCGGTSMTLAGSRTNNNNASNGTTRLYRLAAVSSGAKTISITFSGSDSVAGSSVSYTGVTSVGAAQVASGSTSGTQSHSATCSAGQRLLQTFGESSAFFFTSGTPSGGTNRTNNTGGGSVQCRNSISDATASTTFTQTSSNTVEWASVAVALS